MAVLVVIQRNIFMMSLDEKRLEAFWWKWQDSKKPGKFLDKWNKGTGEIIKQGQTISAIYSQLMNHKVLSPLTKDTEKQMVDTFQTILVLTPL